MAKDAQEAVLWYEKAAEQGYDRAQNNMGRCCEFGIGTPKDLQQAVYWYKKAVDQGYTPAINSLADYYENEEGNFEEAILLYQKSAEKGDAEGQYSYALFNYFGHGDFLPASKDKAIYWLKKSADQGHEKAKQALNKYNNGQMPF